MERQRNSESEDEREERGVVKTEKTDKWEKGKGRMEKKIFRERERARERNGGGRRKPFRMRQPCPPTTLSSPPLLSGRPDWTSSVELIRYSQNPLSNAHLPGALCHGWNERLRSFEDHYPCHISWRHRLPLQLGVNRINWEGIRGWGFDPCFSLYHPHPLTPPPLCNACILVATVSQLHTHLSLSDVGKWRLEWQGFEFQSWANKRTHRARCDETWQHLFSAFWWMNIVFVCISAAYLWRCQLFPRCIPAPNTHTPTPCATCILFLL